LHRANHRDGGALFVWIRLGNCRNQELLAAFARILPDLESLAAHSPRVIEVR
jgi:predicted nuclease of predicted toxin-antitoxin system